MNLLRAEWIKLRSVRVNLVLAFIAALFPMVVVILVSSLSNDPQRHDADKLVEVIIGTMMLTSLLMGVIGALNLTGEFSHGTIRTTFTATPQRSNVLLVKAAVAFVASVVYGALVAALAAIVGRIIMSSRGSTISFESNHWRALSGVVLLGGLLALFGYGLGLLIRNSPATVVVFILWPLLLEGLIALVLTLAGVERAERWLPFQRAFQMAQLNPEEGTGTWSGGLYFACVALALIAIGLVVNQRRDA